MVKSANLGKELVVVDTNKIGVLARISKILAEHGINIEAIAGYAKENKQDAEIMLVADDHLRASDALKKEKYKSVIEREVVIVELENKAGALKIISAKLADAGIDIKHIYGTACTSSCPSKIVLSTSDNEKTLLAVKK